ncbi:MAG: Iron uptake protein A1 [Alphaproteobacteria bacterium MarineAlpha5_Bin5]|nr:MAG: Iron uptake protein A1 [Alphaproteobacteria bacterium MarineAlpha5_Bin5]|tara:strand:- start:4387 stop:5406 length:1020 start_codon:yes stop_codon:yes gene_type:complete
MIIKLIKFFLFNISIFSTPILFSKEINIYSHRQPFLINPFLDLFTEETGIKTNVIYSKTGLAQRLKAEGENSPADVILTVDIGRIYIYDDLNLLAPVNSAKLINNIPVYLRSPNNTWFGLSKRARVIAINKNKIKDGDILRIEDLADKKWKGKICSRPGSHVYNRGIMASVVAALGEKEAEEWAKKLVNNFAKRPQGNDRAQVKAIHEGECDIALINNYYFGKLKFSEDPEQRKWVDNVKLVFPNQGENDRGAHVNISGGGVVKFSKNKENALALLEFLTSEKAQKLYGEINFEYPVNPKVSPSVELQKWGKFREDNLSIIKIAELSPLSQKIIDRVGW